MAKQLTGYDLREAGELVWGDESSPDAMRFITVLLSTLRLLSDIVPKLRKPLIFIPRRASIAPSAVRNKLPENPSFIKDDCI